MDEKHHIQTSVHSKKHQDALEKFRRTLRHEKLMDCTGVNRQQKSSLDMNRTQQKESNLKQEKEWVNLICE